MSTTNDGQPPAPLPLKGPTGSHATVTIGVTGGEGTGVGGGATVVIGGVGAAVARAVGQTVTG